VDIYIEAKRKFDAGNFAQAIEYFEKAIEVRPDFYAAWYYKGLCLEKEEKYEDAIDCYNRIIKGSFADDAQIRKKECFEKIKNEPRADERFAKFQQRKLFSVESSNYKNKSNMSYAQIIENLEKAVKDIEDKGISIKPLNKAIEDLKSHSKSIEAVEKNIGAVRAEVINPIKAELDENKRAGRFSIWGFFVGAFGVAVTAISLLYTTFSPPPQSISLKTSDSNTESNNLDLRLSNIENSLTEMHFFVCGLNGSYQPTSNEIKLSNFESGEILKNGNNIFSVKAHNIYGEIEKKGKWFPRICLTFFINNRQLGAESIKENVKIISNNDISFVNSKGEIILTESDEFVLNNMFKYRIKRIFRTESKILKVCDDMNGVLIEKIE